jgi:hypothetical protein
MHYFQPETPSELAEAAIDDWIEALLPYSQQNIQDACRAHLWDEPRRRPTPGDIRARAAAAAGLQKSKDDGRLKFWADSITEGRYVSTATCSPDLCRELIASGLVTKDQVLRRGLKI